VIRGAVSAMARLAAARRFRALDIGAGSRVDFWRVKAKSDNRFEVGADCMFASRVVYERPGAELCVGSRTFVGRGSMSIAESVHIGDDVLLSWGVTIVDHHSHSLRASERTRDVQEWLKGRKGWTGIKIAPVRIGNRAWLGFDVAVLAGVRIGEGAVVGACSLVTRDVPAWTIVGGNPARIIRELSADER
jgi:acetyltransferase-like isoleucine patch superfamily enzyme